MFNKLKAIKDLRSQAKKMQNTLAEVIEIGEDNGVRVAMDGNQAVVRVEIADDLLSRKEKLEEAVKNACNNAVRKVHKQLASKMKEMGGLDALKGLGL